MADEAIVQEEQTSTEENVSKETEEKKEEQSKEQPFSDEQEARVQQLMTEATAKAVAEAKESGRRELQGEQDRNRNTERRAKLAEGTVNAYESSFNGLDEETRKDIELARYREQEKQYQSTAQEDATKQQEADYYQRLNESILVYLDNLNIPRDDKRIDWGTGSQDYVEARNRLDASVAKIINENKKADTEKMKDDFKVLESSLRKELNLDSVDTTTGSGGGNDSDAEFKKGLGDGSLPLNKANMARAKKMGIA